MIKKSQILSGFIMGIILAAGMNCRVMAKDTDDEMTVSVYTEQYDQADPSEDTEREVESVSEEVALESISEPSVEVEEAPKAVSEPSFVVEDASEDTDEPSAPIETFSTDTFVYEEESPAQIEEAAEVTEAIEETAEAVEFAEVFEEEIEASEAAEEVAPTANAVPVAAMSTTTTITSAAATTVAPKEIIIDGTKVTENKSSEDGTMRFLSDTGRLVLIDHDGSAESIGSSTGGNTILAAGVNRIGTLTCNGDVEIIGTGILLVDNVELGDDGSLSLQTNTDIYKDETGSVALFIKTGENEYTLANGEVTGILDEEYTVKGVKLIVPDKSRLMLNSVGACLDPDTGEVHYYFGSVYGEDPYISTSPDAVVNESASNLIISDGASLTIENGAEILMEIMESFDRAVTHRPTLTTRGTGSLLVDGTISGGGILKFDGTQGTLLGRGTLGAERIDVGNTFLTGNEVVLSAEDIHVHGEGTISRLSVNNSYVTLFDEAAIDHLINTGVTNLIIQKSVVLKDLDISGVLKICTKQFYEELDNTPTATITGNIRGDGTICFGNGINKIARSAVLDGVSISNYDAALVYDYSTQPVTTASEVPLRVRPDNVHSFGVEGQVPLAISIIEEVHFTDEWRSGVTLNFKRLINLKDYQDIVPQIPSSGEIDLSALYELAKTVRTQEKDEIQDLYINAEIFVELLRISNNNELYTTFYEESALSGIVSANDVDLIRLTLVVQLWNPNAGGTETTTNTAFTGTGVLGGSGAGSVSGGKSKLLFGHKSEQPDPEDPNPDPPKPDPDPDPPKPDPDPDPPRPDPDPDPPRPDPDPPIPDPNPPRPDPIDPDPEWHKTVETSASSRPAATQLRVIVTKDKQYYLIRVYRGITEIKELTEITDQKGKVTASFSMPKLPEGWDTGLIFVVFRDLIDGEEVLNAFQAKWDPVTGMLTFETDRTGRFALVCLPLATIEWDLFSEDFYKALSELDIVQKLTVRNANTLQAIATAGKQQ